MAKEQVSGKNHEPVYKFVNIHKLQQNFDVQ